jgi:RNA polymerase sigma factor (sigma-70 family)
MRRDGGYAEAMRHLRTLFTTGATGAGCDAELVERIAAGGQAASRAFEAVVERHGPMVWGVCRSILADRHAAEDAFQATFLVLARRAASLRLSSTLGGWLHGVAVTVARRARADAAKRSRREAPLGDGVARVAAETRPTADPDDLAAVHEELARLATAQRQAIVLCHLQGLSHEQAAAALGWPVGTVRSRLARGRDRLRSQLLRRGISPAVGLGRAADALGGVPPALAAKAVATGTGWIAGGLAPAAGTVPAAVAALGGGVVTTMFTTKLATAGGAAVLGLAAIIGAAGTLSGQEGARQGPRDGEGARPGARDTGRAPAEGPRGGERRGGDAPRDDGRLALPEPTAGEGGPAISTREPARERNIRFGETTRDDFQPARLSGGLADPQPELADRALASRESPHEVTALLKQARMRLEMVKRLARQQVVSTEEVLQSASVVEVLEARQLTLRDAYRDEIELLELRLKANAMARLGAEARLRGARTEYPIQQARHQAGAAADGALDLARAEMTLAEREADLRTIDVARMELEVRIRQVARRLRAVSATADAAPADAPAATEAPAPAERP